MKFNNFLCKFEFERCENEWSLYVCRTSAEPLYLALFVDDGMLFDRCKSDIERIIEALTIELDITVVSANAFVEIEKESDCENKSILHQESYTRKVLNRFKNL